MRPLRVPIILGIVMAPIPQLSAADLNALVREAEANIGPAEALCRFARDGGVDLVPDESGIAALLQYGAAYITLANVLMQARQRIRDQGR